MVNQGLTNNQNKFQNSPPPKIESTNMLDQHLKEQPDPYTFDGEKGCLTLSTYCETPCSSDLTQILT